MGVAFMGTGVASGENRAVEAANKAICSPLLVDTSIEGAKGVLINITGGKDLTLHEVSKASQLIHKLAHPDANIILGTVIDPNSKDFVKVTVIATGFDRMQQKESLVTDDFPLPYPEQLKTPPPFPIQSETPPYEFEPRANSSRWNPPDWEKRWSYYDTPTIIRRRHSQFRKHPNEAS